MSVSWKDYNGKKILYIDYRGMNEEEGIKNVEHQADIMRHLNEKVLVLADYTGTFATLNFMNRLKKLGKEVLEPKTEKGALIGVVGIKKMLLNTYNLFTGGNLKAFNSEEEALKYLVP
jgi:hypothetical protein